MAQNSPDKAFAEKLIDFSKIIRDRALQVKILSAVSLASGAKTSAVTCALQGLKTSINELIQFLCSSALKKSLAATIHQLDAIKKVLAVWNSI